MDIHVYYMDVIGGYPSVSSGPNYTYKVHIFIEYWISLRRVQENIVTSSSILQKQDIQYYYYYLDHPCETMNFPYEQKIP